MLTMDALPAGGGAEPDISPDLSRREAAAIAVRRLAAAGLDGPGLDARLLLADAVGADGAALLAHPEVSLGPDAAVRFRSHLARRLSREPVARILGRAEFWGLRFALSPETLVPRPDTETLVDAALASRPDRAGPAAVLDLGTGSGCILVALLHELPAAFGIGIDRSLDALRTARGNARRNDVGARAAFAAADWAEPIAGGFDLVVSNPPYIRRADLARLEPDVAEHDPVCALDGGPGGLDGVRAVLRATGRCLRPGGTALIEIGHDQAADAAGVAADLGLRVRGTARDLGGHERVLIVAPG